MWSSSSHSRCCCGLQSQKAQSRDTPALADLSLVQIASHAPSPIPFIFGAGWALMPCLCPLERQPWTRPSPGRCRHGCLTLLTWKLLYVSWGLAAVCRGHGPLTGLALLSSWPDTTLGVLQEVPGSQPTPKVLKESHPFFLWMGCKEK